MEEETVDTSLKKIVKGAGIFLLGFVFSLIGGLIFRIIVIRYITQYQFGIISFAYVIILITQTIVTFGIPGAMVRQASYFIGKNETDKAEIVFKVSAYLVALFGVLGFFTIFMTSDLISKIFNMQELSWVLRIVALVIPFGALNSYLVSLHQTFGKVNAKVVFIDILQNLIKIVLILLVVIIGLKFYYVVWAYTLPQIIVFFLFFIYSLEYINNSRDFMGTYALQLLAFALPFLIQSILGSILSWTDIIMIGYYCTPVDVALYNGARPLAATLQSVLSAVVFLYFPVITSLYSKNKITEIKRTYAIITKWLMSVTFPVFLIMFLFSRSILYILFGVKYVNAYEVLRILALGLFLRIVFGPNGITLIAFGETKFITIINLTSALVNIILNAIFIPLWGINGAAVASMISYLVCIVLASFKLYTLYKIHPFTKTYLKPIIVSTLFSGLVYWVFRNFKFNIVDIGIIFVIFILIYFMSLLFTKSFDEEDIMLFCSLEQRLGLNLRCIKNFLKRFI